MTGRALTLDDLYTAWGDIQSLQLSVYCHPIDYALVHDAVNRLRVELGVPDWLVMVHTSEFLHAGRAVAFRQGQPIHFTLPTPGRVTDVT